MPKNRIVAASDYYSIESSNKQKMNDWPDAIFARVGNEGEGYCHVGTPVWYNKIVC